jgi:hypothetical protein
MFPGHYQQVAAFSPVLPVDSLDVTITAPKGLGFSVEAHDVEFHKSDSGNNDVFTLHYANLNPVSEDNAAISQLDRVPRYFVSNFRSYEEFAQSYAAMIESKSAVTVKSAPTRTPSRPESPTGASRRARSMNGSASMCGMSRSPSGRARSCRTTRRAC